MSKIILKNTNNEVMYVFDDFKSVTVSLDKITVGNPVEFFIGDLNSSNSSLIENVTLPEDYEQKKHRYNDGTWVIWEGYDAWILKRQASDIRRQEKKELEALEDE